MTMPFSFQAAVGGPSRPRQTEAINRRRFLARSALAAGLLTTPGSILLAAETAAERELAERRKIEEALPARAPAQPRRARRLLIFTLNVNYGGHPSIATANTAFTLMGRKTGAFETVVSRDPAVFQRESLKQFDAVFFNNNVGNVFEDPALRENLAEFVYGGGGLMGVHGTSVGFTKWPGAVEDWPEFGVMLGARGANHRASDEHVFIKLDDPAHPVNQVFAGRGFDYRDEFFRVHEPYSRQRVRVLLSIDTEKTDLKQGPSYGRLERTDNDYALAWVRQYGRGRTFYCTIAHNPRVFWDPQMLQFYLAAAQFVLGDLSGPTVPSARLTPAIRAQERLGWRLALSPTEASKATLFETIGQAAELGLLCLGAQSAQEIRPDLRRRFDQGLGTNELQEIRLKLDAAGVRLPAWQLATLPPDEVGWRATFAFARRMGIEIVLAPPPQGALDLVEKLCDEHDILLAMQTRRRMSGPGLGLREVVRLCQGRSKRLGLWGGLTYWSQASFASAEAARELDQRLLVLDLDDPDQSPAKMSAVLESLHQRGVKPALFTLKAAAEGPAGASALAAAVAAFNQTSLRLAS